MHHKTASQPASQPVGRPSESRFILAKLSKCTQRALTHSYNYSFGCQYLSPGSFFNFTYPRLLPIRKLDLARGCALSRRQNTRTQTEGQTSKQTNCEFVRCWRSTWLHVLGVSISLRHNRDSSNRAKATNSCPIGVTVENQVFQVSWVRHVNLAA